MRVRLDRAKLALPGLVGCAFVLLGTAPPAVAALNQVSYSNLIDPPVFVSDGDVEDLDPDPLEMRVAFDLADPNGDWTATGVILATTSDPNGATLVVTDTEIRNVTGSPVIAAMIEVDHYFDPLVSFTQQYTAHIDGAFDKIGGGLLGNLSLVDSAKLNGAVTVGNFFFEAHLVEAPVTFDDTSPPLHLDTVNRQTERFVFYTDELDNVIRLFDSASILPEPAMGVPAASGTHLLALVVLLVGALGFAIARRRMGAAPRPVTRT
jgi:hypothetical protein